jgi:hypothetical protein
MARQNINVNPAIREFEAYMDFSGGINTETSNERLADNEFTQMQNVDLNSRGSVKKRTGRVSHTNILETNPSVRNAQGAFFFYRKGQTEPDFIFVANGSLYYRRNNNPISFPITITSAPSATFQNTKIVEAVQIYEELYVATGDENFGIVIVYYDPAMGGSFKAKLMSEYEPNDDEIKFIGTNAMLPYAMKNTNDTTITEVNKFSVKGMVINENVPTNPSVSSGFSNVSYRATVYVTHNTSLAGYNGTPTYKFYYKKSNVVESKEFDVETRGNHNINRVFLSGDYFSEKDTVDLATTAPLPTVSAPSPNTLVFTTTGSVHQIDGVGLGTQRVLVKDQVNQVQNGIYEVTSVSFNPPTNEFTHTLTRQDMLKDSDISNKVFVEVTDGTVNKKKYFRCGLNTGKVETNNITWVGYTPDFSKTYNKFNGNIEVFANNVKLESGTGFKETTSTSFTLTTAVANTKTIFYRWQPDWLDVASDYMKLPANTTSATNDFFFMPLKAGEYSIKVEVTFTDVSITYKKEYVYSNFLVNETRGLEETFKQKVSGIRKCNRIRLYWDVLMLFGDPDESTQLYFSVRGIPNYFPATYNLRFDTGKQEPITTVVRIQDFLTVFTNSTIHAVTGKDAADYKVYLINDSVGCVAPLSAVLTGNVITFLSEEGVFTLRPATFKLEQMNVQRVDRNIQSQMPKDENACALNYDSQYWLCFPDKKEIYRYYYEQNVWVKDTSEKLNFIQFLQEGDNVYNLTKDSYLYKHNETIYKDVGLGYNMVVETKYFDLSKSFNFKKLRRLYVLGKGYVDYDAEFKVKIYADSQIVLDPEVGYAVVGEDGYVTWYPTNQNPIPPTPPNIEFHQASLLGTELNPEWILGEDILGGQELSVQKTRVRGKCRRVKLVFENSQDNEVELFGFGLEFKLKKP